MPNTSGGGAKHKLGMKLIRVRKRIGGPRFVKPTSMSMKMRMLPARRRAGRKHQGPMRSRKERLMLPECNNRRQNKNPEITKRPKRLYGRRKVKPRLTGKKSSPWINTA